MLLGIGLCIHNFLIKGSNWSKLHYPASEPLLFFVPHYNCSIWIKLIGYFCIIFDFNITSAQWLSQNIMHCSTLSYQKCRNFRINFVPHLSICYNTLAHTLCSLSWWTFRFLPWEEGKKERVRGGRYLENGKREEYENWEGGIWESVRIKR